MLATTKVSMPMPLLNPFNSYALFIIVVVHRHYNWVALLVASSLWKPVWCLLVPWTLILSEEAFRSVQGLLESVSEMHIFSNRDLPSTSGGGRPREISMVCNVWGVSWTTLTNNSNEDFS